MGALPATGTWVRLAVPASAVGLDGATVNGMAFTLYGGQADWDQAGTVSAPAAPTGLTATAGNAAVTLNWTASSGAGSYNVYRSTASGQEVRVATGVSGTSFTDSGLTNGTAYYYEVTAVNGNGESAVSNEASATPKAPASAGSVTFLANDAATQGKWASAYGADGYDIGQGPASLPSYAQVNITGNANYTWNGSTSDVRALQNPSTGTGLAACWYSGSSFTIDVNITDGKTHEVALYALDWDSYGPRQEQINVIDPATGNVLNSETVTNFSGGQYLVYNVTGHVQFQVTNLVGGSNAVISGLFFGGKAQTAVVGNGTGLAGQYYSDTNLQNLVLTRTDPTVNFTWPNDTAPVAGLPADNWSVKWTGQVQAQYSQAYTFTTVSDDGVRLYVNGQLVINDWTYHGATTDNSAPIQLVAGQKYSIEMDYFEGGGAATAQLRWSSASTPAGVIPKSQLYKAGFAQAVNLSGSFNRTGMVTDGTSFSNGGFDGDASALSATLLGSGVSWNGQRFNLGAANSNNVISAQGQTIALPQGNYSSLMFLADGVNGNLANLTFTVNYTDGTSQTFTQSFSDWYTPQKYAGESIAVSTSYRILSNGTKQNGPFNVYGYKFALNSGKTVKSITLPNNGNLEILAMNLVL
jgi:hypothetical protein